MKAFQAVPNRLLLNLALALFLGTGLGTVVYLGLVGGLDSGTGQVTDSIGNALTFALVALMFAAIIVLAYAVPLMLLLRRLGFAGPASALIGALLPAGVALLIPEGASLALLFACYGACVGLVFVALAYRGAN